MPALQSPGNGGEPKQDPAAKRTLTGNSAAAPYRPPLLMAAALGRTDVINTLLAATDFSAPAQQFTDHR